MECGPSVDHASSGTWRRRSFGVARSEHSSRNSVKTISPGYSRLQIECWASLRQRVVRSEEQLGHGTWHPKSVGRSAVRSRVWITDRHPQIRHSVVDGLVSGGRQVLPGVGIRRGAPTHRGSCCAGEQCVGAAPGVAGDISFRFGSRQRVRTRARPAKPRITIAVDNLVSHPTSRAVRARTSRGRTSQRPRSQAVRASSLSSQQPASFGTTSACASWGAAAKKVRRRRWGRRRPSGDRTRRPLSCRCRTDPVLVACA
jgi:hypothetical protein